MHAMHHYECVAVCRDTSLQRGRLHVSHDPAKTGPHRGLFSLKLCAAAPVVASAVLWRFNDGAASVCVLIHSCAKKVRRRDAVAPPGFCNRGGVRYGSTGGLEYEVRQSRLYCLFINVALCSTALQCICRVIRRRFMTMKAHTLHNFWTSTHRGKLPPPPLAAPLTGRSAANSTRVIRCGSYRCSVVVLSVCLSLSVGHNRQS